MKQITSLHNPLIKRIITLNEKSRNRKKEKAFLIEGEREIRLGLQGHYRFEVVLFQPDIIPQNQVEELLEGRQIELIAISSQVYQKLCYRGSTEGILAIAQSKNHSLQEISFSKKNPLVLVAEAPEKPGNIGALLRTADAAGLDAVFIANPKTDLYNPNIIRSSVGCVFTIPVAMGTTTEIIDFLNKNNFQIFCAALTASVVYHEVSYVSSTAIVVGTEDIGLSQEWLAHSTQNIIIPMEGIIDSMNVSVAAAVITYEAKRQRIT